jgi:hypothetical protein
MLWRRTCTSCAHRTPTGSCIDRVAIRSSPATTRSSRPWRRRGSNCSASAAASWSSTAKTGAWHSSSGTRDRRGGPIPGPLTRSQAAAGTRRPRPDRGFDASMFRGTEKAKDGGKLPVYRILAARPGHRLRRRGREGHVSATSRARSWLAGRFSGWRPPGPPQACSTTPSRLPSRANRAQRPSTRWRRPLYDNHHRALRRLASPPPSRAYVRGRGV